MGEQVIVLTDLTKQYGNFTAVDHIRLNIRKGEIFGLLGPNGAGKSTTILMMLGLTEPTSGTVEICGINSTTHRFLVIICIIIISFWSCLLFYLIVFQLSSSIST